MFNQPTVHTQPTVHAQPTVHTQPTVPTQAKNLIEKSRNIYILLSDNYNFALAEGDIFCSGLALFYSLKKLGKDVNLFFENIPENFQFLVNPAPVLSQSGDRGNSKFVISINTQREDVSEIFYEKNSDNLKIYLTSSRGELSGEDISFQAQAPTVSPANPGFAPGKTLDGQTGQGRPYGGEPRSFGAGRPNLLITLGITSLESLGNKFEPDFFYQIPILNIDNQPSNENFGEINLIDIKSCSISEITSDLIQNFWPEDKDVATYLLAGIIWASENFRSPRTKPETLKKASLLIENGADHQKIIQNFYKTKPISQIKLLGQILKKISFNQEKELYWAGLTKKDFEDSEASSKDLGGALQELKFTFGNTICSNLLILWEGHASPVFIKGVFYSFQTNLIERVLENFEGVSRGRTALFLIREKEIDSACQKFLATI